jgi:hypothetical protein
MVGQMPVATPIKVHVVIQAPGEKRGFSGWTIQADFNPTAWLDDPVARGGYSVFAAQPLPGFLMHPDADVQRVALMIAYKAPNGTLYYHRLPSELYQTIRSGRTEDVRKVLEGLQARFQQPLAHEKVYPDSPFSEETHGGGMGNAQNGQTWVDLTRLRDDSILTIGDERYFPLPLAAWAARASEASISKWVRNRTKFDGRAIKVHVGPLTGGLYVSETSIGRMANRFVKWPSKEPAGTVTLGETNALTGFLAMSEAGQLLGVSKRTAWLWASQGKAPSQEPLDVIQCKTSGYFYIRERDVLRLKALVPRTGLQRGRRPRVAPQP